MSSAPPLRRGIGSAADSAGVAEGEAAAGKGEAAAGKAPGDGTGEQ